MKTLFELFRRFDARRIFGFIRRLGGMSRPKVKCYDLRSTHALRVEGDQAFYRREPLLQISIHALRVEGDAVLDRNNYVFFVFLSTPSGWRATSFLSIAISSDKISIHALRVEGDMCSSRRIKPPPNFYPRPPGGGRPYRSISSLLSVSVISIHALRVEGDVEATLFRSLILTISIHALRVEGDGYIQPGALGCARISIHALRVEGDRARQP